MIRVVSSILGTLSISDLFVTVLRNQNAVPRLFEPDDGNDSFLDFLDESPFPESQGG